MRCNERGGALLEAAMLMPLILMLLFGMVELGRMAYTYHTLHKVLYGIARHIGSGQGVDFCNTEDAIIREAINLALTGTADGTGEPTVTNLTAADIAVSIERYMASSGELAQCECSVTGCDASSGGLPPDFITVSIPDGYSVRLNIPFVPSDVIQLRPRVRLPNAGT